jgi:hypothetical protein
MAAGRLVRVRPTWAGKKIAASLNNTALLAARIPNLRAPNSSLVSLSSRHLCSGGFGRNAALRFGALSHSTGSTTATRLTAAPVKDGVASLLYCVR